MVWVDLGCGVICDMGRWWQWMWDGGGSGCEYSAAVGNGILICVGVGFRVSGWQRHGGFRLKE